MRLRWLLVPTFALMIAVGGCGEEGAGTIDGSDQDGTPTPEPTPTEEVANFPDEDPREIVAQLLDALGNQDHRVAYDRLVSDFHLLEFEDRWVGLVMNDLLSNRAGHPDERPTPAPETWEVEEYQDFTIVRDPEFPLNALVLRAVDGEWRVDPGDHRLAMAWFITVPEEISRLLGPVPLFAQQPSSRGERTIDGDEYDIAPLQFRPQTFVFDEGLARLTTSISTVPTGDRSEIAEHVTHDATIPLDGLTWESGGESGPVEVVWTDARLQDDELVLPGAEARAAQVSPYYKATLELIGLPGDVDEITMGVEGVQIGPLGEDAPVGQHEPVSVDARYTFTAETTADILLGEVPEIEVPEVPEPGDPIPHEDLPPHEVEDEFEVLEIDYERSESAVEVYMRIATAQVREAPGGEVFEEGLLTWDDGYQSEARILRLNDDVELRSRRTEPPLDAEVSEITFVDQMTRDLEPDHDAVLHEDRIETKWGDFPILDIAEVYGGNVFIYYQPAGHRWVEYVQIEHEGEPIGIMRSSAHGEEVLPEPVGRMTSSTLLDLIDDMPLPATVQVAQVDVDATMTVE